MVQFRRISPEQAGVSSRNLIAFLDALAHRGLEVHSFMMAKGYDVFAEGWYAPYRPESIHPMYSFTKSLTSTAIGFAVAEGALSLDEKVCDIFPEYVRETTPKNIRKATVYHLLTMSCGHEREPATFGDSFIEDFINNPAPYAPGTHFFYNSQGTNVLCAILKRRTGSNLLEYLRPRLFDKIGVREDIDCSKLGGGYDMGGGGSRLHTEDMLRFMRFVMNRGKWDGEQLLNSEWFDMACSRQISTDGEHPAPDSDWNCGYGFQFWMATREGVYRADGAYGQIGIAMPSQDALIVMTMATDRVHEVVKLIWKYIYDPMTDALPADPKAYGDYLSRIAGLSIDVLPVGVSCNSHAVSFPPRITGKLYAPQEPLGFFDLACVFFYGNAEKDTLIDAIGLEYGEKCTLLIKAEGTDYRLPVGVCGSYLYSHFKTDEVAICGRWRSTRSFEMELRAIKRIGGVRLIFRFDGNTLKIQRDYTLHGGFHEPEYDLLLCNMV